MYWVQGDKHGDVVSRWKRTATEGGSRGTRTNLYHAQLEYATTAQYETVRKIALMDPYLQSGHICTCPHVQQAILVHNRVVTHALPLSRCHSRVSSNALPLTHYQ